VPAPETLNVPALALSGVAMLLLFVLHRGLVTTLGACGALALAWHVVSP
jgi:hypothetical protein